jgi:hypothetical protein
LTLVAATAAGCGSSDPNAIKAVPASGTVTFKGSPVDEGTIGFLPEKGRAASGTVKDGHFVLSTYGEGDGAIPGKHKVTVVATRQKAASGKRGDEGAVIYLVPQKYSDPDTSQLEVEVPASGSGDLKVELH